MTNQEIVSAAIPSSDILSALFTSVDDGIVVTDNSGHILFENAAAKKINDNVEIPTDPKERLEHYSRSDESDPTPLGFRDLPFFRALYEGEVKGLELNMRTDKGGMKALVCNSKALYGATGEKIGAVVVFHDRTAEREAYLQKLKLENEHTELLRINTELERFSAIAAHDLKSPLNSITQFVDLLHEELDGKISDDQKELLTYVSRAGGRLRTLIDDLLAYARAGNVGKQFGRVDMNKLTENVLTSLKGQIDSLNASIEVNNLPEAMGDKLGLSQLMQNLIGNALKYKSEMDPVIKVTCSQDGDDQWHFVIADNGLGISEHNQLAAFELFKRVDGASQAEGTGLGLPICKRIVESHGGKIWIESIEGCGTTMHFTLPLSLDN